MDYLKERRSIRKYTNQEISDETLSRLLSLAARSSTTGNMQLYSVVVTRSEENKKALAPVHFNQPMVTQAPIVLTFCADFNRFNQWCKQRKAIPGYDNFQSFLTAMIDAVIFAQTFCIAAEREGLGICYIGTTTYNPDKIIDLLKLPQFVIPVITITLGYPEIIPPQPDRLPLKAIIHQEVYNDYTSQDIDELYTYKESLPEMKKFVEENNKETLAQIFTDIRYTKTNNEHFSKIFLEVLEKQRFMNILH